ncbi:MAG: hypothetical protein JO270_00130 [Acidobacteriaceae bacterium]|nr:hypothetical protein [Acidobacteriaceae bacterium]
MAKKLLFKEWCGRLEAVMREEGDDPKDYDRAAASNYWREGYSPREFYREILSADAADRLEVIDPSFDPRFEL